MAKRKMGKKWQRKVRIYKISACALSGLLMILMPLR